MLPRLDDWASSPLRLDTTPKQLVALLVDVLGGLTDAVDDLTLLLAWTRRPPGKEVRKEVVLTMSELYLPYLDRWDRLEEFLLTCSIAGARLWFERPEEPSQLQRLLDSEPPKRAGWVSSGKKRNRQKRR
ncbi:MAG: hypothetical protein IPJ34_42285 [Myxococcales bacterium]|nr:hypothetical protein [Myxococcales bacterium]